VIDDLKVLAVIPARGGSKEVPRKNLRRVRGRPLIAYTIDAALQSKYIDRIIVSSEDQEILATAATYGAEPLLRPSEFARDDAPSVAPVLHATEVCPEYDAVVLLQPTSPLRTSADVDGALVTWRQLGVPSCVSVCEARESPYWMFSLGVDSKLVPLLPNPLVGRRQDLPLVYVLNGAIYVADVRWLQTTRAFIAESTGAFVMPRERSLDIDTEKDLEQFSLER
jgi:N-acylneuraminate cytidylyltransferase